MNLFKILEQQQIQVPSDTFLMIDLVSFLMWDSNDRLKVSLKKKAWKEHMLFSQNLIFPKL